MNIDFQKTSLSNGLRLVTCPMPESQSVSIMIFCGAGSRFEDKRTNGISHFLEHMLFKGTIKRPTLLDLSTSIDGIGGEFNAFTAKDHTAYYIKCLPNHIDTALDILTDMVLHSRFSEKDIATERGVILQEIAMYEDLPQRRVVDKFESLIYSGSKLAWDIIGTPQSVAKITRHDFVEYTAAYYHPHSLLLSIAGNFSPSKAHTLAQKFLGSLRTNFQKPLPPHDFFVQNKPQLTIINKKTEQTHLILGWHGYPLGHPNRFAEEVLAALLAGPMSSRLFQEIREKRGLAYYVKSHIDRLQDTGYFAIHTGVKIKSSKEAIKIIINESLKLAKNPPEPKELQVFKEWVKGILTLGLEDSIEKARHYGEHELLEEKIETVDEIKKGIDKVTPDDIKTLARELFVNQNLNLALIGPHEPNDQNITKALNI